MIRVSLNTYITPRSSRTLIVRPPRGRPLLGRCCGQVGLESEEGKLADRCREPVAALGVEPGKELVEAEEETEPRDSLPTPDLPSQSVVDDHNIDHCPYRSWCRQCVEGRGREMARRSVDRDYRKVSAVASDYLFGTREGVYTRDEFDEAANGDQWRRSCLCGV